MAAVSGNLTDAGNSASFTPSGTVSEVLATRNNGTGDMFLEAYDPTATKWVFVAGLGTYSISTPDTAIVYRFRSEGVGGDFDYYIGP